MSKKFNKLLVPEGYRHYWSKYPEGYTILEALLNWVDSVNRLTDNVNDWNIYLEDFVENFDEKLAPTVREMLNEMDQDGRLAEIINEEIFSHKADKTYVDDELDGVNTQLAERVTKQELKDKTLELESDLESRVDGNVFNFPELEKNTSPLIVGNNDPDGLGRGGYNFTYATVLKAYKYLSNPIDNYYMYVASHDGDGIYLYTSPTPEGEWTAYNSGFPIITLTDIPWGVGGQVSSPEVTFDKENNRVLLYVHTHLATEGDQQLTSLLTSNNGLNYIAYSSEPVLIPEHLYRWNGRSTSYFKVHKKGNSFYGVYQANSIFGNRQAAGVTTSIGVAYSRDGYDWDLFDTPLYNNPPNDRGAFSPGIFYWQDYFLILYRLGDNNMRGLITRDFNDYDEIGIVLQKGSSADWDDIRVTSPSIMFENGKIYMYYAGIGSTTTGIGLAIGEVSI